MILEIIDGINCRVTDIQDGDLVPVGGSTLNSRFSKFVKVDSNKFLGYSPSSKDSLKIDAIKPLNAIDCAVNCCNG